MGDVYLARDTVLSRYRRACSLLSSS